MPVPARRHSKTRTRSRRAHHALKSVNDAACSNCQAPVLPHVACTACGFYRGRQVLDVTRAKARAMKRAEKKAFAHSQAAEDGAHHDHDHDHDHDHAEEKEEKPKRKPRAKKAEKASE